MAWLITGGCGFLGSNLANAMLSKGESIVILDNLSRVGSRDNLAWLRSRHGGGWHFVETDVRDADAVTRLVKEKKPKVLVHLAGQVAMTTSIENPRLDFEVNALGTFNMLEAVRIHSPTTIVLYSSTNKVYGSLDYLRYEQTETRFLLPDHPNGLDESLPLDGNSPYACSKLAADQYVRDYHRFYGIPTVVFRHSSMYGPRQFATYNQGWIGWFCLKALEMAGPSLLPFTISGCGKQVRDVLHVDDLIRAYLLCVEHIDSAAGDIFNIGGGMDNSLSLLELFSELERLTSYQMRYSQKAWRPGDQKVFVANHRKARQSFHWYPKIDRETGIKGMLEWSREVWSLG